MEAPAAMVMEEGSVTPAALVERSIWAPPAGAAGLKYTVQEEEAPAAKTVGRQFNSVIVPLAA
jgi:hypothetical protein